MANSVDPDQTGAVCSGSMLFASLLNSSVTLGNYLAPMANSADPDQTAPIEEQSVLGPHCLLLYLIHQ